MNRKLCDHISFAGDLKQPAEYVCEACVKHGGNWVHLRTCQTCGVTLCCDDSPGRHMTAHNRETGHPVIISAEPGEKWIYCYVDHLFSDYV
ncbi:MAG: UBP-type zinc finger domain-containing protein [Bacteroidetes bacterium]|nr:UBP-type zinc finger domain-containing protein [Bacteroidota bacterium]